MIQIKKEIISYKAFCIAHDLAINRYSSLESYLKAFRA